MKPAYIELAAFGSYREKTCLDMTRLGNQGLYLITGDTGAGKSTIFDAIAYALYGVASGDSKRDTQVMRNGAAREDEETYVELRFIHAGGEYSVRRNMEFRRKARRGGGTTPEKENAVLRFPDGRVIDGTRRVNAAVTELLGVGSEHFTRILMIAQGDFARLLLSDTRDREPILRAIFGTSIYESFQRELAARASALERELSPLRARIEARFDAGLYPIDHPAYAEIAALAERPSAFRADELAAAMENGQAADAALMGEAQAALAAARSALDSAIARAAEGAQLMADFNGLANSRESLARLDAQETEMAALRAEAEMAGRAERISGAFLAREKARSLMRECESVLNALEKERHRLDARLAECRQAVSAQEKGRPAAEEARRSAAVIERQLPAYAELSALQSALNAAEKQLAAAERAAETSAQRLSALEKRAGEIDARRQDTSAAPAALAKAAAQLRETVARSGELKRLIEKLDALADGKRDYAARIVRMRAAQVSEEQAASRYVQLRREFIASQAGLLAAELTDGAPCPVCGATEHPSPAHTSGEAPDQEALDAAEKAANAARSETMKLSTEAGALHRQLTARFGELCGEFTRLTSLEPGEKPQLADVRAKTAEASKNAELQRAALETECARQDALAREDASLAKERADITQKLPDLSAEKQRADGERESRAGEALSLRERVRQLAGSLEYDDQAAAHSAFEAAKAAYTGWETAMQAAADALSDCIGAVSSASDRDALLREQLNNRRGELTACEAEFGAQLTDAGFTDETAYAAAKRTPERVKAITTRIEEHGRLREFHARTAAQLAEKLAGHEKPDPEALSAAHRAAQENLDACTRSEAAISARKQRVETALEALRRDGAEFSRMGRRLEVAQALSNAANGRSRSNMGRITFERFILIDYFDRVLSQANLRFTRMAGGQYELVRARESGDMRVQTGLELNVVDNFTGRERSVRSLSGGEAFMASLALALGFADVIRQAAGGVTVDAMFVDEGFGSLDPEALDQVMNVLTQLAGGDKLIGIISHVSDLKSRISRRIVVEKTREGSRARIEA